MKKLRVLFMGRYGDSYSIKMYNFLVKNFYKVTVYWCKGITHRPNKFIKKKWKGDFILCFRSYYVLNQKLISRAKIAAINFHPGLPSNRGIGCVNFALLNNAKNYGATAHLISKKVDSGKILGVVKFKIKANDTVESLLDKTYKMQTKQFFKLIKFLNTNKKNLNVLIFKNKNKKWAKKKNNRKQLNQLYEINKNIKKFKLSKIIRATETKKFHPYIKLFGKKFIYCG